MANISVTYSFTNGTTIDADQINQNFTDIINGTSDGTKDFSINALTAASTATFNGNTTIGNASSDDLTVNASLASTIPVKTTNTYDIGGSSSAHRYLYLAAGGTYTARVGAGTASANWNLTLPTSAGSAYQSLRSGATAGTLAFSEARVPAASAPSGNVSKGISDGDCFILTPTADITLTLDNTFKSGRIVTIINLATAYDVTVKANDATTIFTLYRASRNQVLCGADSPATNTDWRVLNVVTSPWIVGASPSSQLGSGWGTISNGEQAYKRDGDQLHWWAKWENGTVTANAANCVLPLSLSIDTTKIGPSLKHIFPGRAYDLLNSGSTLPQFVCYYNSGSASAVYFAQASNADSITAGNVNAFFNNSDTITFHVVIPISGWGMYTG